MSLTAYLSFPYATTTVFADLSMDGPFDEPDDYFLRRQKEGQMKQVSEASG